MKKLTFCLLLAISTCGYAQVKEDLFDDSEPTFEEIPIEPETMIYYYALVKKNESQRLMDKTKSTSEYIYHRGQLDAYNDILGYLFRD